MTDIIAFDVGLGSILVGDGVTDEQHAGKRIGDRSVDEPGYKFPVEVENNRDE